MHKHWKDVSKKSKYRSVNILCYIQHTVKTNDSNQNAQMHCGFDDEKGLNFCETDIMYCEVLQHTCS